MSDLATNDNNVLAPRKLNPKVEIMKALKENPALIQKVPKDQKTNEMINYVLSMAPDALQYLNKEEQTSERCMKSITFDAMNLRHVIDQSDKIDVVYKALEQNYEVLQYVERQTPDLCEQIIRARPDAVRFLKIRDPQLYYLAVSLDPTTIQYIPHEFQDIEIMRLASNRQVNLDHIANPTPEIMATVFNNDRAAIENIDAISQKYQFLKIEFDNTILKVSYNDNIKVLIYDPEKKKYSYTNFTKDLLGMIFAYIRTNSGDRGLNAAKELFSKNKSDAKLVEKDPEFTSGLFVIETNKNNYELWEKTVEEQVYPGMLSWLYVNEYMTVVKKVKLIRTYNLMEMTYQEYV